VVVISDFRVDATGWAAMAQALSRVACRHELLPVRVEAPGLVHLPRVGLVSIRDPETGRCTVVDSSSASVRAELRRMEEEEREQWAGLCRRLGSAPLHIDPSAPLAPQLHRRLGRRARGAA